VGRRASSSALALCAPLGGGPASNTRHGAKSSALRESGQKIAASNSYLSTMLRVRIALREAFEHVDVERFLEHPEGSDEPDLGQGLVELPHLAGVKHPGLLSPGERATAYRVREIADALIRHGGAYDDEQAIGRDRALQVELDLELQDVRALPDVVAHAAQNFDHQVAERGVRFSEHDQGRAHAPPGCRARAVGVGAFPGASKRLWCRLRGSFRANVPKGVTTSGDTVLRKLPVKRSPREAEALRRERLVAARCLKDLQDVALLDLFERDELAEIVACDDHVS
jgi:hypothetical protein